MPFDTIEFQLGGWWASALINGDTSGLTDKEERQLAAFVAEVQTENPGGYWDGFAEEDSQGFCRDDITDLAGECYTVCYVFPVAHV